MCLRLLRASRLSDFHFLFIRATVIPLVLYLTVAEHQQHQKKQEQEEEEEEEHKEEEEEQEEKEEQDWEEEEW